MNKKVLIFACLAGGALLILVVMMIFSTGKETVSQSAVGSNLISPTQALVNTTNNSVSASSSPVLSTVPSSSNTSGQGQSQLQTYNNGAFALKYPENWLMKDKSLTGMPSYKFVQNLAGYYDPIAPYIIVTQFPNSNESLKQRESLLGLPPVTPPVKKSIGNETADLFSSEMDGPVVSGQSYGKLQSSTYYLQHGTSQFLIEVQYSASPSRAEDKATIESILSSISFL